jgi:DnaJ-domain-containing protein 1
MGCFTDQVKLTRALVRNLDEAIKEVKLLGEHEEESSWKITELETICKKLRDDTQRVEEEKATLEEMVESRDELLMEIARETGLDRMGEDEEEEEEDADDGGDAAAPPATASPPLVPPAAVPEEINEEGPMEAILGKEVPLPHEVIMAEAEP